MALIALPDKEGPDGSAWIWINPAHITTVRPVFERSQDADGDLVHLYAVLELQGVPEFRAWLARCADSGAAEAKWQSFLATVAQGLAL